MNDTLNNNYFVDVSMNILKGFIVLGGLSSIFGAFLVAALFFFYGPLDALTKEQLKWCEEYRSSLTYEECPKEAGA